MKNNNSFKTTFYLGLIVLTLTVSILTIVFINLYRYVSPKFKKDKIEIIAQEIKPEKQIIHDTVYIDRPVVKNNEITKNVSVIKPKISPKVLTEKDTIISIIKDTTDSIK
jgi:membrane glycosyltransferase